MLVFPLYSRSAVIFAALYHAELAAPNAAYIQLKAVIRTSNVRGRPRVNSKGSVRVGQVPCILRTLAGALLAIPRGFIVAKFARQISRTCITSRPRGDRGFLEQRATVRLLVSRHCHRTYYDCHGSDQPRNSNVLCIERDILLVRSFYVGRDPIL